MHKKHFFFKTICKKIVFHRSCFVPGVHERSEGEGRHDPAHVGGAGPPDEPAQRHVVHLRRVLAGQQEPVGSIRQRASVRANQLVLKLSCFFVL